MDKKHNNKNLSYGVIEKALFDYGVSGSVVNHFCGPTVTSYQYVPKPGTKVSKIVGLSSEIALSLEVDTVGIDAGFGQKSIGIEVPNKHRRFLSLRSSLEKVMNSPKEGLPLVIGETSEGDTVIEDLCVMPHLLIAGATGAGKSVYLNCIICSLLSRSFDVDLELILIDPKHLELSVYSGLTHLARPVVTQYDDAVNSLEWACEEMERRCTTTHTCARAFSRESAGVQRSRFSRTTTGGESRKTSAACCTRRDPTSGPEENML